MSRIGTSNRISKRDALRESIVEGVGVVHRFISNLFEKKIDKMIVLLRDFIARW